MLFRHVLLLFKINFFEKLFQEYYQSIKHLYLDQTRRSFGPDLVPDCLQKLSVDDTRRQSVNVTTPAVFYIASLTFSTQHTIMNFGDH